MPTTTPTSSAVYFLAAAPNSGVLRFANSSRPNELSPGAGSGTTGAYREWNPLNFGGSEYAPVEGRLVLFPAKQRHEVLANESDADRLSISFDLVVSTRAGRPGGVHEFLMPPPERWRRLPRPEPTGTLRADRPLDLAALARRASDLDAWTLPAVDSHPLWATAIHRHCASEQDWREHSRATAAEGSPTVDPRPVLPDAANWTTYRAAVDRTYDHLVGLGVSTNGATVTPATIGAGGEPDGPYARSSTDLIVYVRLDDTAATCAIELEEGAAPSTLEPRSMAVVSGYRRHRLAGGDVTVLRFGVDVPSLARPGRPDAASVDDRTAFLAATALPLDAPRPSSTVIAAKLERASRHERRDRRRGRCTVSQKFLVDGADPRGATDAERQVIRSHGTTDEAVVDRLTDVVHRLALFDAQQCRDLVAYGRQRMTAIVPDSVDGDPEYQVDLGVEQLAEIVGASAVDRLLALPQQHGGFDRAPAPGVALFLRVFSPDTRAHIAFHTDVSSWTANVPLDAPDDASGGRLLMLYGGALRDEPRVQGEVLSHRNDLVHGVSRVERGERWSLIALFPPSDEQHCRDTTTDDDHHETEEMACHSAT